MSSVTTEDGQPGDEGGVAAHPHSRHPFWPFGLLLAVNSLSLPAMVGLILYVQLFFDQFAYVYLYPILGAVMEAQLFLLALWLSLGGRPKRWRSLLVFGIVAGGGLVFGSAVFAVWCWHGNYDAGSSSIQYFIIYVIGAPLMASALLWLANALLLIPAWFFGVEINYGESNSSPTKPRRTFGINHIFSWTAQVAVPLALINAAVIVLGYPEELTSAAIPFVLVIACCSPFVAVLLRRRLSGVYFGIACVWAALVASTAMCFPTYWSFLHPYWVFWVHCIVVFLNTLALRRMGLCWVPRGEGAGQST